ncbi:hypothetical protein Mgra_00003438 [Meloidogyne graminicola]|uniref:Uncharacterized protein n=1 Tax=Meloidogyne graminicola TaxID=189291 RepID=A0A8S9ZV59_9BILA|nr:hypothetical protein Mgra_00003438 [Meloidogyne graminicola]
MVARSKAKGKSMLNKPNKNPVSASTMFKLRALAKKNLEEKEGTLSNKRKRLEEIVGRVEEKMFGERKDGEGTSKE